jgi:hypothetical protein
MFSYVFQSSKTIKQRWGNAPALSYAWFTTSFHWTNEAYMSSNNDQLFGQLSEINNYLYDIFCLTLRLFSGHANIPAPIPSYLRYFTPFKFGATAHPVQTRTLFCRRRPIRCPGRVSKITTVHHQAHYLSRYENIYFAFTFIYFLFIFFKFWQQVTELHGYNKL